MAIRANLTVDQGADFVATFNITDDDGYPIDLSEYTGESYFRQHYSSVTFYQFDVSTESNGALTLALSSNTSNDIRPGRYVYDVEVTANDGKKSRVVQGIVTITPQVTR